MSYRTSEAREEARAALARRLTRVRESRDRIARHEDEQEIFRALASLDLPKQKRALPVLSLLPRVRIASPCREPWDAMEGDERARHCSRCERDVYDVSQLTTVEVEQLLRGHMALPEGGLPCLRLHRRADGTVLTADCPSATPFKHAAQATAIAATAAGLFVSWPHETASAPRAASVARAEREIRQEGSVHVDGTWGDGARNTPSVMMGGGLDMRPGSPEATRHVSAMERLDELVPEDVETPRWVRSGGSSSPTAASVWMGGTIAARE